MLTSHCVVYLWTQRHRWWCCFCPVVDTQHVKDFCGLSWSLFCFSWSYSGCWLVKMIHIDLLHGFKYNWNFKTLVNIIVWLTEIQKVGRTHLGNAAGDWFFSYTCAPQSAADLAKRSMHAPWFAHQTLIQECISINVWKDAKRELNEKLLISYLTKVKSYGTTCCIPFKQVSLVYTSMLILHCSGQCSHE